MRNKKGNFQTIERVLNAIGEKDLIRLFYKHDITNLWLLFLGEDLLYRLNPRVLRRFKTT
jgi:hypothetical protein